MLPDYRGGINMARNFGKSLGAKFSGLFAASNTDGNDFLIYQRTRFDYTWDRS